MAVILDDLFAGSFRGASFLVLSATTSGGRKQAKHEYPNSNKQSIEDLGFLPRNYKISALINAETPTDKRTYFQKRDALLAALEKGGLGTLSHPFFSGSMDVVARNWTINETFKTLGYSSIELEFDISDRFTNPQPQSPSLSAIKKQRKKVQLSIKDSIIAKLKAAAPQAFKAVQANLDAFSAQLASATSTFNQIKSEVNAYAAELQQFNTDITSLIQVPQNLADSMISLMNTSAGLYTTEAAAIQVFQRMFNFGDNITRPTPTTVQRVEIAQNTNVVSYGTQASYLGLTYEVASEASFDSVDQIETVQELMETQYSKMVNSGFVDEEVIEQLTTMRAMVNQWLEETKLNASQVLVIKIKTVPLSVVAYRYYGAVDDFDALVDKLVQLNRPQADNLTFMTDSMKVLTI